MSLTAPEWRESPLYLTHGDSWPVADLPDSVLYIRHAGTLAEYSDEEIARQYLGGEIHGDNYRSDWQNGSAKSAAETLRRLQNGEPTQPLLDAFGKAQRAATDTELPAVASVRRRRVWSAEDGEADIDRALSGREDAFRLRRKVKAQRVIRLGWGTVQSGSTSEESFAAVAAVVVAAAERLEQAGYAVEILAVDFRLWQTGRPEIGSKAIRAGFNAARRYSAAVVTLKAANQPLDVSTLLAAGLPGLLRIFGFADALRTFGGTEGAQGSVPMIGNNSDGKAAADLMARENLSVLFQSPPSRSKLGLEEATKAMLSAVAEGRTYAQ